MVLRQAKSVNRPSGISISRPFDRRDSLDQRLLAQSIFDDLLDGAHLQLMFSAELFEIGKPSHVAVGT